MTNEGPCLPGVFRQSVAGDDKMHVAGKPVSVMKGIVEICPEGGTVLDPFAGSGTTLVACVKTGRQGIGIEIEPAYIPIIERRLRDAEAPLFESLSSSKDTIPCVASLF